MVVGTALDDRTVPGSGRVLSLAITVSLADRRDTRRVRTLLNSELVREGTRLDDDFDT
jgi:hypothetical protein